MDEVNEIAFKNLLSRLAKQKIICSPYVTDIPIDLNEFNVKNLNTKRIRANFDSYTICQKFTLFKNSLQCEIFVFQGVNESTFFVIKKKKQYTRLSLNSLGRDIRKYFIDA